MLGIMPGTQEALKKNPPNLLLSASTHYSFSLALLVLLSEMVSVTLHFCHIMHSLEIVQYAKLNNFPQIHRTGLTETFVSSGKSS